MTAHRMHGLAFASHADILREASVVFYLTSLKVKATFVEQEGSGDRKLEFDFPLWLDVLGKFARHSDLRGLDHLADVSYQDGRISSWYPRKRLASKILVWKFETLTCAQLKERAYTLGRLVEKQWPREEMDIDYAITPEKLKEILEQARVFADGFVKQVDDDRLAMRRLKRLTRNY